MKDILVGIGTFLLILALMLIGVVLLIALVAPLSVVSPESQGAIYEFLKDCLAAEVIIIFLAAACLLLGR